MEIVIRKITFETAKLALKLGFNGNVTGTHIYSYYNDNGTLGDVGSSHIYINHPIHAPQSLLKDWIRETHNIHVEIYCNASGWGWLLTKLNGTTIKEIEDDIFYEDYYDALEIGLGKALKTIKC